MLGAIKSKLLLEVARILRQKCTNIFRDLISTVENPQRENLSRNIHTHKKKTNSQKLNEIIRTGE